MIMHIFHRLAGRVRLAFRGRPQPLLDESDDAARAIVGAQSHGNIRLQQGRFYMKSDLDGRLARIRRFRFAERL